MIGRGDHLKKVIEIVAGPNGSGKTTFAQSYFLNTKKNLVFLNPDLIASGIAPLDFENASFHAGRVLISEVTIYFLYLDSVKENLKRIQKRVKMGGHPISKESVLRRHPRCFNNFWNLYRPLNADWYILDNSGKKPKTIQSKAVFENLPEKAQKRFVDQFLKDTSHD